MRIFLFILISLSFIACSKNKGNDNPPANTDSLSTGWKKITLPAHQGGADVFFINNTTGFVAGGSQISRSTDGGNTWQKVYQSNASFVNIAMGSATNAIFVTAGSSAFKILVTTNGGNSFDSIAIADNSLTDVFFVSSTVAYAIGQKCWKTTNGGLNWTSTFDFGSATTGYKSLHFINEQTGWCAGTGGIFNTTNGGVNWNPQSASNFVFGLTGNIFFPDANNGYISDDNSVGKSINGGAAWTKAFALGGGYHDLHFVTATTGYVSDNMYIYKTIDGGSTWTRVVRLASGMIIELHFTDANHGWAVFDGYILKLEQ
jgi:photosystem II stability/assembly factor-like uncharacterized protein